MQVYNTYLVALFLANGVDVRHERLLQVINNVRHEDLDPHFVGDLGSLRVGLHIERKNARIPAAMSDTDGQTHKPYSRWCSSIVDA